MFHRPLAQEVRGFLPNSMLYVLRLDEIHQEVSGNKWFKLKYNMERARKERASCVLTFGGAYSNHIPATAAACAEANLPAVGIIRGEEHLPLNPTLARARQLGMQLHYMSREEYRRKNSPEVLTQLRRAYGDFFLIPEGGTNADAIRGAEEIPSLIHTSYDVLCCPVGTGGTITGLIKGGAKDAKKIGFSALKGDFIKDDVDKLLAEKRSDYEIVTEYHFGGYAKFAPELIDFINTFKAKTAIPLDPIYTGKMMYGIYDLDKKNYFGKGKTIVAVHTGGLQGIAGFNQRYKDHQII